MSDALLTLIMETDVAEHVEDLLLSRPDLVSGFTANPSEGHGSVVELAEPHELVAGHAPRIVIRTAGPEAKMRDILALIKAEMPRANIFYWLLPLIAMGKL